MISFTDYALAVYPFLELEWFHRTYYRVLEAFADGRIRRLMISMPPQHGKSVGATTLLPAYLLGLDPDLRIAIASYSASLASKFNRRVQRILESAEYGELFPATTIKRGAKPANYVRTADEVEIVGHEGSLLSVGREGSLTGNRVDCFLLDDLYKDAMEANSPLIRENCWEWYTSVVRTRMHNASRELMVFTRWHEEDLIGMLRRRERVVELHAWSDLDRVPAGGWLALDFEALKTAAPTEIDPRAAGEALWPARHDAALLRAKRALDPLRFECMYQGRPSVREGLLYGDQFVEYDTLPREIVRRANYTDTADTGDDYLCCIVYVETEIGNFILDVYYTQAAMETTEPETARILTKWEVEEAIIESNNGGRGFARNVEKNLRLMGNKKTVIRWFHQSENKDVRIFNHSNEVQNLTHFPKDWAHLFPKFHQAITKYKKQGTNTHDDAPDALTGTVEKRPDGKADIKRLKRIFK